MKGYIKFNRFVDLEASLEQLLSQIHREPMTPTSWKWALIAAHSALQGSMCIALRGGAGFDTWKPSHLKKWLEAYEKSVDLPDPHLDYFLELFDRLFCGESGIDRCLISWLNETRNNLVHFNTDHYAIERKSIISSINASVSATIVASTRSKGVFFYEEQQPDRFHTLCESILARLKVLVDD
ncbi:MULTISPECIES: hypothetical protein [Pseudomonas putida group]|uniref:hypothetical protein n=1 Tax=Pseudomonas putida group TaxID=136845 RepID=UPI001BAFD802|nr:MULTISPECIES: hypothetical protein [Pseudomonas putida group]MCE1054441.1 hypothetical protein [Pseudomonas alloputida]QUG87839.1 hypothetical protein GR140_03430 [Pseudomonas putida]